MAAKVTKVIASIEQSIPVTQHNAQVIDVESIKCECCGLTEECTPAYIARVCERYEGRWICGLCAEAVKDESIRSLSKITTGEAVKRHMKFHKAFKSSIPPVNPTEDLISAMKQLFRRSLDSPKKDASRSLGRSNSCFSSMPRRRSHYD
ncbi:uncharacterized protein LOC111446520 [Cucurbita moschata]|uniref:Uncharacterized protein LOC111446520 n=1 Tax=Cucurbita moschata TaxID=3662 RepID=A0A6J1FLK3_CUCMO|nr:uncharacterized protein LOC111446520 [Cucurbita moschata]